MAVTAAQLGPWHRRVLPSLADLLFPALALSQLNGGRFADADTGWHLWAGTDALRHGPRAIPDALSFTRAGTPWHDPAWLGDALLALAHAHAGPFGVALLVGLAYAAAFAWLYRALLRDTGHVPAALLAALLASQVAVMHLLARPVVFSFLLLVAAWEPLRVPGRERRAAWLVPLLAALWANVHPSAVLAPALAAFAWLARGRDRRLALAALLSLAALGATPSGFGWLGDMLPRGDSLVLFRGIDEWRSPQFAEPRFWLTLATLVVALVARRAGPRLARGEAVLGLACVAGPLVAARLAPIAAILWAPFLARDLAAWAPQRGGGAAGRAWRGAQATLAPFERVLRPGPWPALVAVVAFALAPRLAGSFPEAAAGFPADAFPRAAMVRAAELGLGPRVVNSYGWGGFVSWEYGGRWKVFIDGRAGFFGGEPLADYLRLTRLDPDWPAALERWRPDWMLLQRDAPLVAAAPLTGRWRVAYRDTLAAILVPVPPPADPRAATAAPTRTPAAP